ncbi:MAG: two-component system OmpR family response regulator [Candidatus Aldehydirespiratoraceae bacterium]|jgi:two-component system OmpR family response regulator
MLVGDAGPVSKARVLVVDDDDNISFLVASALRLAGIDVEVAATGRDGLDLVDNFAPDAIVLDVMLPDMDGYDVLQLLRGRSHLMPVLFLTARGDTEDRVRGLTAGGDDYITKPFALEELVARVQLSLRRAGAADLTSSSTLDVADLVLDDDAHRVMRYGEPVHLTPTEYKLCRYLLNNAGRVVSRSQILDHVWDYDFDGQSGIVETFISSLRKKVDYVEPHLIETVRGVGYTIRPPT